MFAGLALLLAAASGVAASEQLAYRVSYRGPFSAGELVHIGSVLLRRDAVVLAGQAGKLIDTSLWASSETSGFAESIAPYRYARRSLLRADGGETLAFETLKQTGKRRHELQVLGPDRTLLRYRDQPSKQREVPLPAWVQSWLGDRSGLHQRDSRAWPGQGALLDQLSLLHLLRTQPLSPGIRRFEVVEGRHLLQYLVEVEGPEEIQQGGRSKSAWRVRFDAQRLDGDPGEAGAHASVWAWIGKDAERTPLRFEHRHVIGDFRVELTESAGWPEAPCHWSEIVARASCR